MFNEHVWALFSCWYSLLLLYAHLTLTFMFSFLSFSLEKNLHVKCFDTQTLIHYNVPLGSSKDRRAMGFISVTATISASWCMKFHLKGNDMSVRQDLRQQVFSEGKLSQIKRERYLIKFCFSFLWHLNLFLYGFGLKQFAIVFKKPHF